MQTMLPPSQTQSPQPQYEITDADKARQQAIADAWIAYHGLLDPPLQKMPDGTDPNVMTNRCQAIVDEGKRFLFGQELEISVEDDAPEEVQTLLDDIWGRKERRVPLLQNLAMNGAMAGRAFLRVVPSRNGKKFRLVAIDPSIVFVQTAPQDCETVLLYCIEYSVDSRKDGKPVKLFYREEIQRIDPDGNASLGLPDDDDTWSIQHWSRIGERGQWTSAGEPITWPYPFSPLFSCPNLSKPNNFWCQPDITPDIIGVNKALNLNLSCINLIQILYGQPILYATGTGQTVIDVQPGRILGLPLPESKIVAVNIVSDVANALAYSHDLRSDIDEQSSVPGVATGRISDLPRGNISGIAIELLFMPLLKKTDEKRCLYGELIIEVSKALLVLNGMSGDIDITLAWQNPLPHDDLSAVQAATAKQAIGISNSTLQRELGYDPEEEAELSQTEDTQALINFSRGQGMPPMPPEQQQPQMMTQQQPQGAL